MLLTFGLASRLNQADFGSLMFAYLSIAVARGFASALFIEPLLVDHGDTKGETAASSHSALCLFGATATALTTIGATIFSPATGWLLFSLAMIPVLSQDLGRAVALKANRAGVAAVGELLWLAIVCIGLFATSSPNGLLVAWLAGAILAPAVTWSRLQTSLFASVSTWRHGFLPRGRSFAVEFAAQRGTSQLVVWSLRFLVPLAEFGSLRGAQALFGFSNAATAGGTPLALVWSSKRSGDRSANAVPLGFAVCLATLSLAPLLVLFWPEIGKELLGATFSGVEPLIVPLVIQRVGASFTAGALVALRIGGRDRASRRARIVSSALTLSLGLGGALSFGVSGAVWGFASAGALGGLVWWASVLCDRPEAALSTSV